MPSKITDFSPKQISDLARRSGWTVGPLGKGSLAGITYEQGGGISMHAPNGSSIYIQYHPGGGPVSYTHLDVYKRQDLYL